MLVVWSSCRSPVRLSLAGAKNAISLFAAVKSAMSTASFACPATHQTCGSRIFPCMEPGMVHH